MKKKGHKGVQAELPPLVIATDTEREEMVDQHTSKRDGAQPKTALIIETERDKLVDTLDADLKGVVPKTALIKDTSNDFTPFWKRKLFTRSLVESQPEVLSVAPQAEGLSHKETTAREGAVFEKFEYDSFDSADSDDFSNYSDFHDNVDHKQDLSTNVVKKPT